MPLFTDAIASFRRRTPEPPTSNWYDYMAAIREGSIELTDGTQASYTQIYRENVWVKAAVDTIALSLMRMPTLTYQRNGREKERQYDGGLYRLMEVRPCAGWTPSDYRAFIGKSVGIFGNALIVKLGMNDESDEPTELFPAPSTGWRVNGREYVWTDRNGDQYPFKRWQIAHFRFWDVDQNGFGISPMEALRRTVSNDDAARRYAESSFKYGAHPGSVLRTDKDLNEDTAKKLAANWNARHGGIEHAFKTAVLTHGLDYARYDSDLEKSAVVAHRDYAPVEVGAAYRIPAAILGFVKEANFASMDMYHQMLYQDSLGPWVVMLEERTQLDIVDPTPAWQGQFVEVNMNAVLRGNLESRVRAYATAISSSQMTPDEARALENRPPMAAIQPEAGMLQFQLNSSAGAVGAQLAEDSGQEDETPVTTQNGLASLNGVR